ncbi:unnamed protein product [Pylaiella littoralis]
MLRVLLATATLPSLSGPAVLGSWQGAVAAFVAPTSALKPLADKVVLGHSSGCHRRLPLLHHHHQQAQGTKQHRPRQRPADPWAPCSPQWDTETPEGWHQSSSSSSSSSSDPPSVTAAPTSDISLYRGIMPRQGEEGAVERVGGNDGADVAPGATAGAVEKVVGAPAATATVGPGATIDENTARRPESTSEEPPQQSSGAAEKGVGQDSDRFGEHGWFSPAGAAEVGVGSVFSWSEGGAPRSSQVPATAGSGVPQEHKSQSEAISGKGEENEGGDKDGDWSERRKLVENWEEHDEVWISMRQEAKAAAEKEPLLVSFVYSTILNQKTLEAAVAFHLANKLAGPHMLSTQVQALVREYFADVGTPFRRHLRRDIIAVRERDPACDSYHDCLLYFKGFQALQTHRVAHWLYHSGRHALAFYLQSQVNQEFQIDIHPGAKFGEGVFIDHGTGIVVGETAVVGDDVSMLHRVTLGGSGVKSADRHPKIGNGVLIGAGACLLGNIRVGKGTQIGAGSLVVTDLPERCVAVGVPAKVLGQGRKREPALAMGQDFFKEVWKGLDI